MKSHFVCIVFGLLAPLMIWAQESAPWFNRAQLAYNEAQYDSAVMILKEHAEMLDYRALFLLGNAMQKLEDFSAAISAYDRAEQLNARAAELYINRGSALIWSGELEAAEQDLKQAREKDDRNYKLFYYLGVLNFYKYKLKAAVKALDACLDMESGYAPAFYLRGACYGELGRYNQAIADYSKAYDLDPSLTVALYNIAVVKYLDKDFFSAQQDFSQLLESDLNNKPLIHYYKAECAYYLNDKREACQDYKHAADLGDEMSREIYDKYCLKGEKRKELPRRETQSISL